MKYIAKDEEIASNSRDFNRIECHINFVGGNYTGKMHISCQQVFFALIVSSCQQA